MRSPLGFGILVVLILGFVCVSTISCFNYEDSAEEDVPASQNVPAQVESNSLPETGNEEISAQQAKRGLGMPAPVSSREMSSTPELVNADVQQEGTIAAPVNEPVIGSNNSNSKESSQEPSSQARGLGSDIMSAIGNDGSNEQIQMPQVRPEDIPTIIENGRQVGPQQKTNGNQQQSTQLKGQQSPPETDLTQSQSSSNSTVSSARTFDSWTNCVGSSSNKYGTCKNDVECSKSKGRADGSCMGGFGVCCVMALSCGDKSLENNTFFANPDFPEPSWEARLCEVEVKKKSKSILQVMIEFEEFELAPPNYEGECITDVFQVKLASNRPSPYSLLRVCGQNTGQHMYLDVSQIEEPLVLSVATSGGGYPRRWSIRIVQMDEKNFLLAPPGCLQYYTDTVGHFRSFNLGRNLKNLYYAICFRIDNGYSGIRFNENFFGMNGPSCRRRIGAGGVGIRGGRYNGSFEAHPHHLVIPPLGYARPPPRPRFEPHANLGYHEGLHNYGPQNHHQQGPSQFGPLPLFNRQKRLAYSEPGARVTRTHHEHEHEKEAKLEEKEFKHEGFRHPHAPPIYGPSYGPPSQGYGPYPTSYEYPQYHESKKGEFKEDFKEKFDDKFGQQEKFYGRHGEYSGEPSKVLSWKDKVGDTIGWNAKQEVKHEVKYGPYHSTYAPTYGSHSGQAYGHQGYNHQGYGHQGYNHQGYGHQGYGEYHHKEIDKFGKKFEHLEYKHEHNHQGKENEKTSGGWWPSWGKKEEKKEKDKYFQHHEALFPMMHIPEMPHCEPRFCGQNDVITFPPSGDSISEMCGNRFNRGRGPKIISGSPLVVYVSNRGHNRGAGFDMNYEQVFYIPKPY